MILLSDTMLQTSSFDHTSNYRPLYISLIWADRSDESCNQTSGRKNCRRKCSVRVAYFDLIKHRKVLKITGDRMFS